MYGVCSVLYIYVYSEILPAAQLHFRGRNVRGAFPGRRDRAVFTGRDGPRLLGGWVGLNRRPKEKKEKKNLTLGVGGGGEKYHWVVRGPRGLVIRDVTGHEIRHHVTGALL